MLLQAWRKPVSRTSFRPPSITEAFQRHQVVVVRKPSQPSPREARGSIITSIRFRPVIRYESFRRGEFRTVASREGASGKRWRETPKMPPSSHLRFIVHGENRSAPRRRLVITLAHARTARKKPRESLVVFEETADLASWRSRDTLLCRLPERARAPALQTRIDSS